MRRMPLSATQDSHQSIERERIRLEVARSPHDDPHRASQGDDEDRRDPDYGREGDRRCAGRDDHRAVVGIPLRQEESGARGCSCQRESRQDDATEAPGRRGGTGRRAEGVRDENSERRGCVRGYPSCDAVRSSAEELEEVRREQDGGKDNTPIVDTAAISSLRRQNSYGARRCSARRTSLRSERFSAPSKLRSARNRSTPTRDVLSIHTPHGMPKRRRTDFRRRASSSSCSRSRDEW
jgi:hypothetical protein